ncbi:hypothetical protein MKX03_011969 [Papaver bracteatum]|nr:hypothetical protein MKX03_011969 [Papaver bracteatum]
MGANGRKLVLLGLVFAVVLLISSEVVACKDMPEKTRATIVDEEKNLGNGGIEYDIEHAGNEVEAELNKDGDEVEVEYAGKEVEVELNKTGAKVEIEIGGKKFEMQVKG